MAVLEGTGLNWLDLAVLTVMLVTLLLGLLSGLVWQLYRIVSIILGLFFSSRLARPVSDYIGKNVIENESARLFISYTAVFVAVIIVCYIVGRLLKKLISKVKFGPIDTILGGVMGMVKGAFVCGIILIGVYNFSPEDSTQVAAVDESLVARRLVIICKNLYGVLPASFREKVSDKLDGLKDRLDEKAKEKIGEEVKKKITGGEKEEPADKKTDAGGKGAESKAAPTEDGLE